MKVQTRKLREVMALLDPVIPRKPRIPILKYILLKEGKAIATDLENTVILEFPEAEGEVLIHRDALEFLRFIPGDTIAEISEQTGEPRTISIACGGSRRTLPSADPLDYPTLPSEPGIQVHPDGDRLIEALGMASPYACKYQSRLILTGVTLTLGEQGAWVASGDGYRMFYKDVPGTFAVPTTVVISTPAVAILKDLWKKASKPADPAVDALLAQVALAKRLIALGFKGGPGEGEERNSSHDLMVARFGEVTLLSRLIGGNPPPWKELIPKDPPQKVKVFAQEFYRALLQVKDVALEERGALRLLWRENAIKIIATGGDGETAEAEAFATIEGGEGHIAFDIRYLLEYFKQRQGVVELGVKNPESACLFSDGRCAVVVMPMYFQEKSPESGAKAEGSGAETNITEYEGYGQGNVQETETVEASAIEPNEVIEG